MGSRHFTDKIYISVQVKNIKVSVKYYSLTSYIALCSPRRDILIKKLFRLPENCTRGYLKFSGLAARSVNCKWYNFLPLSAVVSLFCESV
jgi:hypothetical protein